MSYNGWLFLAFAALQPIFYALFFYLGKHLFEVDKPVEKPVEKSKKATGPEPESDEDRKRRILLENIDNYYTVKKQKEVI